MSILLRFDPDTGDLGRGIKVTALEFAVAVPHVANILEALYKEAIFEDRPHKFKYGFEIYNNEAKHLELAIKDLLKQLPDHVNFYEVDGRRAFEIRGPAGGVVFSLMVYLITG